MLISERLQSLQKVKEMPLILLDSTLLSHLGKNGHNFLKNCFPECSLNFEGYCLNGGVCIYFGIDNLFSCQ